MSYDQACYQRRKNLTLKKTNRDEFIAYALIKERWSFDDLYTHKLLQTHTLTEILQWTLFNGEFTPKELYII